jgi:transcription antitermination factor NusG
MLSDLSNASRVWAVLAVKPRKEDPTLLFFRKEGFEVYCPKLKKRFGYRAPEPFFPGYIFAWLSPKVELPQVRYFPGVRRPLLFGGQVACVEEELVEFWRTREGGRGFITPDPPAPFDIGQRVRFKEGIFMGIEGVVLENLPSRERVRVLLEYLSGTVTVEVDRAVLG